ncbi:MAG: DUF1015 domain-containing protein, partial [Flavobacteriales bacterium]|nr:DUF1015 domain-containing protein [Flavobacteriales bacterium]
MSVLKPFKAVRPTADKVEAVACRPYDVLNAKEARISADGNPVSFYNVIKPEINFPDGYDVYDESIYKKGRENYELLKSNGVLNQDENEMFYVYQLIMDGHTQTGIVGCCSIDDYFNNVIKKHELTRPDKEEDRKNHVRHGKINAEPVFFSYAHVDAIDAIVDRIKSTSEPVYDFKADDGIQHTLWTVTQDSDNSALETLFDNDVPAIYVADGHHRTAAGGL